MAKKSKKKRKFAKYKPGKKPFCCKKKPHSKKRVRCFESKVSRDYWCKHGVKPR